MFKITVKQAVAYNSPIAKALFCSNEKVFPVKDGAAILNLITQIRVHLTTYNSAIEKAVKDNGGTISNRGAINYKDNESRDKTEEAISNLNAEKIELVGNKIRPGDDWPRLSLAEVSLLSPILDC